MVYNYFFIIAKTDIHNAQIMPNEGLWMFALKSGNCLRALGAVGAAALLNGVTVAETVALLELILTLWQRRLLRNLKHEFWPVLKRIFTDRLYDSILATLDPSNPLLIPLPRRLFRQYPLLLPRPDSQKCRPQAWSRKMDRPRQRFSNRLTVILSTVLC